MDFPFYKNIKGKLKKRGLPFKKSGQDDAPNQLVSLAKQLDEQDQLSSDLCQLAIASCKASLATNQIGEFLLVARTLSKTQGELNEEHVQLIVHVYSEALLICDRSLIRPIKLEMGRFYESQKMYSEAAECYKQSMSISLCVRNLILAERYENALDELKNCPSHIMNPSLYTSMCLLQLLLDDEVDEVKRSSLLQLAMLSRSATNRGVIPLSDHLFDLTGLLESLLIVQQDIATHSKDERQAKDAKIKNLIVNRLCAFLDSTQIELLHMIIADKQHTDACSGDNQEKIDNLEVRGLRLDEESISKEP